jgi:hypothetical protein
MESCRVRNNGKLWLNVNSAHSFRPQYFDATIAESPPTIEYQKVMSNDQGVGEWATLIVCPVAPTKVYTAYAFQRKHGFCYVDGCPPTPEATESLLERIAFIRRTHYGKPHGSTCHCMLGCGTKPSKATSGISRQISPLKTRPTPTAPCRPTQIPPISPSQPAFKCSISSHTQTAKAGIPCWWMGFELRSF